MAEKPPAGPARANVPTGPKVSGTRTAISLVLLVIVLIVCVIEVRAGLGQYLTLKAFAEKSQDNIFTDVTLAEALGMIAMFPSSPVVTEGPAEDSYHYKWFSLLRPLAGKEVPELYLSADHSDPPRAVSFYTSTEGEEADPVFNPNAADAPMTPPAGMQGMRGGGGPGGPPRDNPSGESGEKQGGGGLRPPLEGDEPATAEPTKEEPTKEEPATEEPAKTEDGNPPSASESGESEKTDDPEVPNDEKTEAPADPN